MTRNHRFKGQALIFKLSNDRIALDAMDLKIFFYDAMDRMRRKISRHGFWIAFRVETELCKTTWTAYDCIGGCFIALS